MAFTVATTTSSQGGSPTSHTVALPDGSDVSGRLVIVIFGVDGNPTVTWPSGWTEIAADTVTGNDDPRLEVRYRRIDGTEGFTGTGDTITITTDVSERSAHQSYLISDGHHATSAPEAASPVGGGSDTSPDPPSLSPSWGAEANLWIPAGATDNSTTFSGAPTNYTNLVNSSIGDPGGTAVGTARRELDAASEDPGTFTIDNSRIWLTTTIAVRPAAAGTTFEQSVAGTITPTGALVQQAQKTLTGSAEPTGVLTRQTEKTLGGTVTPTGTVATTLVRLISIAGSIAPVGTLVRQAQKLLGGGLTPSGTVGKSVAKTFSGTISPAGTLLKLASKLLGGSVAPAGTVATQATTPTADPNPIRITHRENAAVEFREHATITYREPS